jgi:hypothetical protein
VGYRRATGSSRAYLSPDGQEWVKLAPAIQLAVEPVTVPAAAGMVTQSAEGVGVAVPAPEPQAPSYTTGLDAVAPNPTNPSATVRFSLAAAGTVRLTVYDVRGRRVKGLLSDALSAGPHVVDWNGRDDSGELVSSGIYYVRMDVEGQVFQRSVTLVR